MEHENKQVITSYKRAIYSGTFDPITNGHMDIIIRASKIFDEVIIAVAQSEKKAPMFSHEQRIDFVKAATQGIKGVSVVGFDTLLVDLATDLAVNTIIRGLRAVSDFEYELQMGYANSSINKNIETLYLMPTLENAFVSSTIVREIIHFDGKFEHLVPKEVIEYVVLEGVDTAGKSTQLNILQQNHPDALFTKEPGGTPMGVKLREMALGGEARSSIAEMFLFLADRAEHMEEVVKPNQDKLVISDRSVISGIAYANNFPLEVVTSLNLIVTNNTLPTHAILLELSESELRNRLSQKEHDSIESRGIDYLMDIQNRMKETMELLNINHLYIDASLSIETIAKKIEDFINE